jgi:hypothetical protein
VKRSKIVLWLLSLFTLFNIIDLITAMFILPGEANPIYLLTGSKSILFILKFVVIGLAWYVYLKRTYPSKVFYFTFIFVLLTGTLLIGTGIASNIYGILNPEVIEAASNVSTSEKVSYYFTLVGFLFFLPYILSLLSYIIHEKTSSTIRIEPKKKK